MVDTIAAVVHDGRRNRIAVVAHVAGATAAAAVLGVILGGLGALAGGPWGRAGLAIVALAAAVYFLRDAAALRIPLPERKAQVPAWWRTFFTAPVATGLYGLVLGIGFATHLTYGTFVVVCAGAIASGDPLTGMLICAPFGLARGIVVTASAVRWGRDVDALERAAARRVARPFAAASSALIGVTALFGLFL